MAPQNPRPQLALPLARSDSGGCNMNAMTDISADEAFEREGRVNVDMEPEELLVVLLTTDLRDDDGEAETE